MWRAASASLRSARAALPTRQVQPVRLRAIGGELPHISAPRGGQRQQAKTQWPGRLCDRQRRGRSPPLPEISKAQRRELQHRQPRHPTQPDGPPRSCGPGVSARSSPAARPPCRPGAHSLSGPGRCPRSMTPGTAAAPAPGCWPRLLRPAADGGALRKPQRSARDLRQGPRTRAATDSGSKQGYCVPTLLRQLRHITSRYTPCRVRGTPRTYNAGLCAIALQGQQHKPGTGYGCSRSGVTPARSGAPPPAQAARAAPPCWAVSGWQRWLVAGSLPGAAAYRPAAAAPCCSSPGRGQVGAAQARPGPPPLAHPAQGAACPAHTRCRSHPSSTKAPAGNQQPGRGFCRQPQGGRRWCNINDASTKKQQARE